MADQLENSNHKPPYEGGHDPEQNSEKRQTLDRIVEFDNAVEGKTITNIYYDCLERIFDFLDLESLLMVAQTCKRLQIAAIAKFGDEYGGKFFYMCPTDVDSPPISILVNFHFSVNRWKLCFSFLRCFGSKIKNLSVDYYNESAATRIGHFDRFINQCCAKTLTGFAISENPSFSIQNFQSKPFINVEILNIFGIDLQNELPLFVNCFPNLRIMYQNKNRCTR